jgi:transposase
MSRPISILELTKEERSELLRRSRASTTARRDCFRAEVILLRAKGQSEAEVARALDTSVTTVSLWSRRFEQSGLEGLVDKPGRGRKSFLPVEKVKQIIEKVTQPPKGRQRWSARTMAAAAGVSHRTVQRVVASVKVQQFCR